MDDATLLFEVMGFQLCGHVLCCAACPQGSESRHPIILFTSIDTALWDSAKYRN